MVWAKATYFTAWSFSRLSAYRQCPLKAKLSNIDKIPEPKSPAMERGTAIHKLAEDYVKGASGARVPSELKAFADEMKALRKLRKKDEALVSVEEMWVFRRDWTETARNDWDGAWLRVKLDVAWLDDKTVMIIDHKTGKFSPQWNLPDYIEQLDLYATAGLIKYADVGADLRVVPMLYFHDAAVQYPKAGEGKVYSPDMLKGLKKYWEKESKLMLADRTFAPKPNRWCSSCHYRKANKAAGGGQCVY